MPSDRLDRKKLDELEGLVQHFDRRKANAKARLKGQSGSFWYFALLGFEYSGDRYEVASLGAIQPVIDPPGEIELANPAIAERPGMEGS